MPIAVCSQISRCRCRLCQQSLVPRRRARPAASRTYKTGAAVFLRGDPGDSLYGVVTGRVRISASTPGGKEVFLNIMEPGDAFGEIALLDGQPRTAAAMTLSPTELIIIKRDDFLALVKREPQLAVHLIELLCKRVRWTSEQMEDSSAPQRTGAARQAPAESCDVARSQDAGRCAAEDISGRPCAVPRFVSPNRQQTSADVETPELDQPGPR